ncbi:major facilitator superfamily domain-containing protein [Suillus fuscotomentosus]|uniref:Major facilitator superfamily domain-containing protein n=1 Tax=Suillus fuscotomentosus TaxID=1912939 RepID=A0AAD4DPS1_9AGAM|nr:major facilitator superfamily domain-containing protein [Suillus fuscotomentosus]KAG1888927.1 major facilitator superfamily domain-containing protein [Suillus fuscotomentosus]
MDTSNPPRMISETTTLVVVARTKKPKTPLPKLQMGILMVLQLVEPIASMSIFPYINQLIRELGITGGDDAAVGYYAGIIESLFFVAQTLTMLRWSRLSDRIGRKPVLLVGLSGTCISILCFGLSTTFWGLVVSRCMCGVLNGNVSVMKTMVGELTDSTNMAQGFALIPIMWCIGGFIGPLIGGTLARPQDSWPGLFANPFWSKYPYFLPCVVSASGIIVGFFVLLFFLEETLSTKRRPKLTATTLGNSNGVDSNNREDLSQTSNMPLQSLLTPTIVIPIANYAMLALLDIALMALLPLFFSTPTYLGGLGFTPSRIGMWMAMFAISDGIFQALFFAKIVDWVGPKRLFCVSVSCFTPVVLMFPIMSWLVHTRGMVDHAIVFTLVSQLALTIIWDMAFGTVFMFITASAPTKNVLGTINGLGQTSASMARVIGPAFATSLFALSKEHNILNGNAVYVVLILLAGILRWLGSQLPDEIQDRDE